jgi:hypothetical protein
MFLSKPYLSIYENVVDIYVPNIIELLKGDITKMISIICFDVCKEG